MSQEYVLQISLSYDISKSLKCFHGHFLNLFHVAEIYSDSYPEDYANLSKNVNSIMGQKAVKDIITAP